MGWPPDSSPFVPNSGQAGKLSCRSRVHRHRISYEAALRHSRLPVRTDLFHPPMHPGTPQTVEILLLVRPYVAQYQANQEDTRNDHEPQVPDGGGREREEIPVQWNGEDDFADDRRIGD